MNFWLVSKGLRSDFHCLNRRRRCNRFSSDFDRHGKLFEWNHCERTNLENPSFQRGLYIRCFSWNCLLETWPNCDTPKILAGLVAKFKWRKTSFMDIILNKINVNWVFFVWHEKNKPNFFCAIYLLKIGPWVNNSGHPWYITSDVYELHLVKK